MARLVERAVTPISPVGKVSKHRPKDPGNPALPATAQAGFTLVELLVVISVLAIVSLGVGLSTGGAFGRNSAGSIADELTQNITQTRQQAVLGRVVLGLQPQRNGWQVMQRRGQGDWQALPGGQAEHSAVLSWQINGARFVPGAQQATPPILFAPDGRMTPLSLRIAQGGRQVGCAGDGAGSFACQSP